MDEQQATDLYRVVFTMWNSVRGQEGAIWLERALLAAGLELSTIATERGWGSIPPPAAIQNPGHLEVVKVQAAARLCPPADGDT